MQMQQDTIHFLAHIHLCTAAFHVNVNNIDKKQT